MKVKSNIYAIALPESEDLLCYFKELVVDAGLSLVNDGLFASAEHLPAEEEFMRCFQDIDALLVFYSPQNHTDQVCRDRIEKIIHYAQNRDIRVFVLAMENYTKPIYHVIDNQWVRINTDAELEKEKRYFGNVVWLINEDGWIRRGVRLGLAKMIGQLRVESEKTSLYGKLNMLKQLSYSNAIAETLSDLIWIVCDALKTENEPPLRRRLYKELWALLIELRGCNYLQGTYDENRAAAHKQLDAIRIAISLLEEPEFRTPDLFFAAYAIGMRYLFALIQHDMVEYCTNDDVHLLLEPDRRAAHIREQKPYVEAYMAAMAREDCVNVLEAYPQDERTIILEAKNMFLKDLTADKHGVYIIKDGVTHEPYSPSRKNEERQVGEEEKLLIEISVVLRKAMELFDQIPDGANAEAYYRYLRTAYERLKNYSQTVGSELVAVECINRISEIMAILDHKNPQSYMEGKSIAGLRSLLGLKMSADGEYDVFISYKHENEDIARRLYSYCEMHHISPFLDFKTLPDLSKSDYEEAIMNALEHSKHFVVILTDFSQLKSHWINLEMRVFEHEMSEGRKENANFIFVVSDQVFEDIIATNKRCIPIQYRGFEIMQISDYREKLSGYLT